MMGPPPSPEYLAESTTSRIYIAAAICMVISTTFFACRMISRFITHVGFKLSDGILLAGLCTCRPQSIS